MLSLLFGIKKDTAEKKDDEAELSPLSVSDSSVSAPIQRVPALAHSPQLEIVKGSPGEVKSKESISATIDVKPRAGSSTPPIAITPPSASFMPMANRNREERSVEQESPDQKGDYVFSVGSPPGVHDARRKPIELRYKKH